jgi:hypothetical protein
MKIKKKKRIFMSRKLTKEDLQKIANERNHTVIVFENYQNVKSDVTIQCCTCDTIFTTSVHSYKNAKKTGCPECKKRIASETHKGKMTSEQTKQKIGEKAKQRPGSLTGKTGSLHPRSKGGLARDFKNPSTADYAWKTGVRKRCCYTCVIFLEKQKRGQKGFVCHHLNSYDIYVEQRYLIENGVYLTRKIHKEFFDLYGYANNTESQFVEFCQLHYNFDWFERKKELQLQ